MRESSRPSAPRRARRASSRGSLARPVASPSSTSDIDCQTCVGDRNRSQSAVKISFSVRAITLARCRGRGATGRGPCQRPLAGDQFACREPGRSAGRSSDPTGPTRPARGGASHRVRRSVPPPAQPSRGVFLGRRERLQLRIERGGRSLRSVRMLIQPIPGVAVARLNHAVLEIFQDPRDPHDPVEIAGQVAANALKASAAWPSRGKPNRQGARGSRQLNRKVDFAGGVQCA